MTWDQFLFMVIWPVVGAGLFGSFMWWLVKRIP